MDARSESYFPAVHPDLVKVLRHADQLPQPWEVVYGIRTMAAEQAALAAGNSKTLKSRHLPQIRYATTAFPAGLSCAVDVACLEGRSVSFEPGHEQYKFGLVAAQIKKSAMELGVPIQWGGDTIGAWTPGVVSHFRDWGHFQLPWAQYP